MQQERSSLYRTSRTEGKGVPNPPPSEEKERQQAELRRFMDYECNYKKHKGKPWGLVYQEDRQYFEWAMTTMNPTTRTYQVLSRACTEETREKNRINTAFKLQTLK